jgi:hypothetical protein
MWAGEEYQPLAELAEISGYASTHLGWLIRQGRLAGIKRWQLNPK